MSKSILVTDKPKSCETCELSTVIMGKHYCPKKGTYVSKGERDCSCPLGDIPEPLTYSQEKGLANASYIQGWNDCLKTLLGNS